MVGETQLLYGPVETLVNPEISASRTPCGKILRAHGKDARFFEMARENSFKTSRLTAFGSTRRAQTKPEDDQNIAALLRAETKSVTVFGKSWDLDATEILDVSLDENLRMIEEAGEG